MFLYIPSKTIYNNLFKQDPIKGKKKTLTINYIDSKGKTIEGKYIENSEVRIDNLEKLNTAFYGKDTVLIDVSEIIRSKLTIKKESMVIKKQVNTSQSIKVKAVLWKPSGGLGHCLHNLAWAYKFCLKNNSKLYINGLNTHIPYQETFEKSLEFIDKSVIVEEISNIRLFYKKYNIDEKYLQLIKNANYKTQMKYISDDRSIVLICGTARVSVKNLLKFKDDYISNILKNPYKYFKNDYNIISSKDEIPLKFHISGSYVKQLSVTNKMLGVTSKDNDYLNKPKTLELVYIDTNGKKIIYPMIEKSEHTINNIKEIISCSYGILDKKRDVTDKIRTKFCHYDKTLHRSFDDKQKKIVEQIIKSKKYVAVHYRGRDKKVGGGMSKKLSEILNISKKTKITNVFVATDCPKFFNFLCEKEKSLTFFRYTSPPETGKNIHYNTSDFKKGENLYKTLLDIFTCKRSQHFIPSIGSGFSNITREFE